MRPGALWLFYRGRLRARPVHEVFALLGIATGVALVFAVIVANASIAGSVDQLVHAVTGRATLEVAARGEQGFDQGEVKRIAAVPGVAIAAPLLERRATIRGRHGSRTVTLVGVTSKAVSLGGITTPSFKQLGGLIQTLRALLLPQPIADDIGADIKHEAVLSTNGRTRRMFAIPFPEKVIGTLAQSPVAVTSLGYLQALTANPRHPDAMARILPPAGSVDAPVRVHR